MKNTIAIAILGLATAGCASALRLDPALQRVTSATEHFDVAAPQTDAGEAARVAALAEETYRLYADELGVRPARALLVVFPTREAYDAAVGAGDALYVPGAPARLLVSAESDARVLRHEVAHHFLGELLGPVPEWIAEGAAEYLAQVRRVEGRPAVSGLAAIHLDHVLSGERAPSCRHGHVDYARAWWAVATRLESGDGPLRDRLRGLASASSASGVPARWEPELEEILVADADPWARAAAARVLSRWGRRDAIRSALAAERAVGVRAVMAGELARAGEREPLREIAGRIECPHALALVSRSVGRGFESVDALRSWLR